VEAGQLRRQLGLFDAVVYRWDTHQLIRAGLAGGSGVPAAVATHPARAGDEAQPVACELALCRSRRSKSLVSVWCPPVPDVGFSTDMTVSFDLGTLLGEGPDRGQRSRRRLRSCYGWLRS
jgi:hypothetical protein